MNFTGPLEDRIAIRELCDRFCEGVMSKNTEMTGGTWAESCEWVRFGLREDSEARTPSEGRTTATRLSEFPL